MNRARFSENAMIHIDEVVVGRVGKTYNGKAGQCCCGCAGNYAYTEEQAKSAGYEVKVSPVSIKNTVNKINAGLRGEFALDLLIITDSYVSIEVGEKMYTAYYFSKEG